MSDNIPTPASKRKAPFVLKYNQAEAEEAWHIHKALMQAQRAAPVLQDDPRFVAIRDEAYQRFHAAFARG